MTEVVVLIGLQGTGKSTFAGRFVAAGHAWVSKDHFRNNRRPARRQRQLVEEALAAGRSVVVDNTNVAAADRRELVELAHAHGAAAVGYFFVPDPDACRERNARRAGKARVPDAAIGMTLRRLEPPTAAEGFDRLFTVRLIDGDDFEVSDAAGRT